ncbi:hypothetical protein [Dokdonella sp.]|uniref:hypothetical protein n=1 Tax=Dokdonella sp. TaxID=2291710 RepID=UPI0035274AA3
MSRKLAEQRQREAQIETGREAHHAATEYLNAVQGDVYKVGAEIARVEQQIQHSRVLASKATAVRAKKPNVCKRTPNWPSTSPDTSQVESLRLILSDSAPQREAHEAVEKAAEVLSVAEASLAEWQEKRDAYARSSSEAGCGGRG